MVTASENLLDSILTYDEAGTFQKNVWSSERNLDVGHGFRAM